MFEYFFPNYYTVSAFASTLFSLFIAGFLFTVPNRSPATTHFAWLMSWMTVLNLSYLFNNGLYGHATFFWRWLSGVAVLFGTVHSYRFFSTLYRPPKNRRTFFIMFAFALAMCIMAFYLFIKQPLRYSLSAHNWEAAATEEFRVGGYMLLLYFVGLYGLAIYYTIKSKGQKRTAFTLFTIAIIAVTLLPAVLNLLSRIGFISRDVFQTAILLFTIVGFFVMLIVFINFTQDRTTFMAKIVVISLVSILLVLQAASLFWFLTARGAYHQSRLDAGDKIELSPNTARLYPADYRYRVSYDPYKKAIKTHGTLPSGQLKTLIQPAMLNSLLWHRLDRAPNNSVNSILKESPSSFRAYKATLENFLGEGLSKDDALQKALGLRRRIAFAYSAIDMLATDTFKAEIQSFLPQIEQSLPAFVEVAQSVTADSTLPNHSLKGAILALFAPFAPPGVDQFRGSELLSTQGAAFKHFVSYIFINNNQIHEVGFDYLAYRRSLARTGWAQMIMIFSVFIFVVFGFRVFFKKTLINPINDIVTGISAVDAGDLNRKVPVYMEDEIGFMAEAFNRMVDSVRTSKDKIQEYADHLEDKVADRTKELSDSLDKIRALKIQQDGDYFLTTMLIEPLGVNHAKHPNSKVEFYLKQKKEFQFRKWERSIGGDINIAHSVTLRGKPYTVFVNADAMGKSIQGAGGALVFGSVFLSIVERTLAVEGIANQYPERWLKNAIIELHNVFESFNGSMLISAFVGLIDDESGTLYYISAEHPEAILYRDKKAQFLEYSGILHKLGTNLPFQGPLVIDICQLNENDQIIAGSDGKDDLVISQDSSGTRIINDDPQVFMDLVVKAEGRVNDIVSEIDKHGSLMDDLSIIKLTWTTSTAAAANGTTDSIESRIDDLQEAYAGFRAKKDWQSVEQILLEALALDKNRPSLHKKLAQTQYRLHKYKEAIAYGERFMDLNPVETSFLVFLSWCYRKNKDYFGAIDVAERHRLREPENLEVVEFLIHCYARVGNSKREFELKKILQTNANEEIEA